MDEEKNGSRTCVDTGGGDGGCSGDIRSSKRLKQKKVPQRGLGVAQLEKIRLEEQQKKDVVLQAQACRSIFPPNHEIVRLPTNKYSSTLALQTPNLKSSNDPSADTAHNGRLSALNRPFFIPPSSISLPTISPNGASSTNSLFRPSPSMPNIDDLCSNQITLPKSFSSGGGFVDSWPKLWNDGFNLDSDNQKLDHDGDPILHFPNSMQRTLKSQQPHPSSKMEPPSNQSYFLNKYTPLWHEEEKMVGLKRQYPFSMDIPPAPPFHEKLSSSFVDGFEASHESASGINGSPTIPKPRNPMIRGPSSSSLQAEQNSRKVVQENGDFLRLAPPLAASLSLDAKRETQPDNSGHSKKELQKASQELFEDRSRRPITSGSSKLNGQPFFSFLPSTNFGSCDSEVGERVDLSLKL